MRLRTLPLSLRGLRSVYFTWLVAFGILVGLHGRVFAGDPCEVMLAMHQQEHSGHDHDPDLPCDPSHDDQCPIDHHHHCACAHAMPLSVDQGVFAGLGRNGFSMAPIRSESEVPPDGPFSDLDKPPLI